MICQVSQRALMVDVVDIKKAPSGAFLNDLT